MPQKREIKRKCRGEARARAAARGGGRRQRRWFYGGQEGHRCFKISTARPRAYGIFTYLIGLEHACRDARACPDAPVPTSPPRDLQIYSTALQNRPPVSWCRKSRPCLRSKPADDGANSAHPFRGVLSWNTALATWNPGPGCDFCLHATVTAKNAISGQNLATRAASRVSQVPCRATRDGREPLPRSYTTQAPLACAR